MKLFPCLLIAVSLKLSSLTAQQLPKTLLWRITGKDGRHTSYLYGTMHLTDDRVFNLGDSLYAAIAQSEGFAMELDPSALTALLVDEIKKTITNTKSLKELLSEKEYKTYGPSLAKKLGKPVDEITSGDILREKNKWITDAYRKGKMPTFLDTYLYDIARRQDKWTGGVEDADDQRGLLNDVIDENDIRFLLSDDQDSLGHHSSSTSLSSMIDVYADQNLSAIDSMETNLANRDVILIKRNGKMAGRMDSLSAVRSMVFAVGAAHLPGEDGLINLLRKRGFDVQPVISDRKIRASDYKVKELPRTWEEVRDEDSLYQVSMPGKPEDIEIYGVVKMKMYFDLFEGIGYFSTAVQSVYGDKGTDSLMDNWAKLVFKTKGKKEYKPINIFGAKGRIYEATDQEGYKKAMFLNSDNMVYLVYAMSIQETEKNIRNADQFVRSFHMLKRNQSMSDSSMLVFIPHTDTSMAYRVATPFLVRPYNVAPVKNGWNSSLYISADVKSGIYFIFGVNGVERGHYIPNDSTYLNDLKKSAVANVGSLISDSSWMMGDLRVNEFRAGMKQSDYEMLCRYIARGNRWYPLVAMCPRKMEGSPVIGRFFSSFTLLDYPAHSWQVSIPPDSAFRIWTPSPVIVDSPSESANLSSTDAAYNSFDSSRSMTYSVTAVHLSSYFWSSSDSVFWRDRIKADISYKDSLIAKRPVKNGDAGGWEWLELEQGSHNYVRRRALLYGDELYYLFAAGLRDEIESDNVNRFFAEFRFLRPAPTCTLLQPKSERLLKDLESDDSSVSAAARVYLYSAPFAVKDLPLMHQALLHWRASKEGWPSGGLIQRIGELHDSSSFDFAVDNYTAASDTNVRLKNDLLSLMADFPDSVHYSVLTTMLRTHPPSGDLSFMLRFKLIREWGSMRPFLPGLMPLLGDSLIRPSMISLFAGMVDSGCLGKETLAPYRATLLKYGDHRIRPQADSAGSSFSDKDLVELLGQFNDVRTNALLQKFLAVKENYIRRYALTALLRNKQEPAAGGVQALAADRSYRLDSYRELKKYGLIRLFPAAYRTPKAIAAALINDMADQDEEEVDSMTFVTSVIRDIGQGPRRFFFFRIANGASYLACAGPFNVAPPSTARWYNDDGKAFVLYDKEYEPGQRQEQIEELLSKFSEDKEEP